jgi:molybdopterin molybdotransferase
MSLLPVDEALQRILHDMGPLPAETVPLADAAGRVLGATLEARHTQPPFVASAMDGYAVRAEDIASVPARLSVIGESAAGRRFGGRVGPGEAVRIFTGAPLPPGADTILIQENAAILEGGRIEAREQVAKGRHVRRTGLDFREGETVLQGGRVLDPAALSLAAAAGHAELPVVRRPLVAVIATGDELVAPGDIPGPDQIVASNSFGIGALARLDGAEVLDLGIVPDSEAAIVAALDRAQSAGADIVVTLGGASVGEHDLVRAALAARGIELAFWKIAMRPGKPLMFARRDKACILGLPGNPVSSLVCAHLFLRPMIARLSGRPFAPDLREAVLGAPMNANDERRDYVRAVAMPRDDKLVATPFPLQDSSMLTTLAQANALIVREPNASKAEAGTPCHVLMIR